MANKKLLIVLTLSCYLLAFLVHAGARIDNKLYQLLGMPQKLARNENPPREPLAFSWQNCDTSGPDKLLALSVTPDPITLGNNVTLSFDGIIGAPATNATLGRMEVTIWKKILGIWTEIPCIDMIGSCTYPSLCALLDDPNWTSQCEPVVGKYNVPCKCPWTEKEYKVPATSTITTDPGLSWLASGDYSAQAKLFDNAGKELGCVLVYASLQEKGAK